MQNDPNVGGASWLISRIPADDEQRTSYLTHLSSFYTLIYNFDYTIAV